MEYCLCVPLGCAAHQLTCSVQPDGHAEWDSINCHIKINGLEWHALFCNMA